ncbi:hypothetical protein LCGC14_1632140 [marine sediment metagenome]|uniref:Uncharacterized protein n=1 Tax=marine sediment metagenome TaxID=412755 RepID=A0A0F9IPI4_9ZZZZ
MATLIRHIPYNNADGHVQSNSSRVSGNIQFTFIQLGRSGPTGNLLRDSWLQFTDIAIPRAAKIISAVITYKARLSDSGATCRMRIYGEATANATFPGTWADYHPKPKTTAYTPWNPPAFVAETEYTTPNIGAVVQEIIDLPAWVSGYSLVILPWENGGNSNTLRNPYDYFQDPAKAPFITIDWVPAGMRGLGSGAMAELMLG